MADAYKQLAQAVGTGSTASLLSPAAGANVIVREIYVANDTGGALSFKIYHDDDGSTFDSTTILMTSTTIPANDFFQNAVHIGADNSAGAIGWDGEVGLTITLYGVNRT